MRLALTVALIALAAGPVLAGPIHTFTALAISPAGDRIASVEKDDLGQAAAPAHGKIVIRAVADGEILATLDPCPACDYPDLTFGKDGALAFLERDRAAGTVTLKIASGSTTRVIAKINGIADTPRFSPDGKRIAMLVTLNAAKESGARQAGVRQVGEIGKTSDEQRIAVFDLAAAGPVTDVKPVSPADRYVYEYDWTPDSRGFVVTSALGNGDNNWWVATLDAIDAATGAVRSIARPKTQLDYPRVSPDGRTVAYIGGLMSDFGSVGGDIWTVPFTGGAPANATKDDKATVTSFTWTAGGIRETRLMGANAQIARFTPGKPTEVLWEKPSSFAAGDGKVVYSADGAIVATVVSDFEHAQALYAGPAAAPLKITADNDAITGVATARSITWKSDGFSVQGWLLTPIGADPKKKAAMITIVHGGPSSASVPTFVGDNGPADYLKAGYYVFMPNPRGSFGQGQAFTVANKRAFGIGDLRDILAGIDAAEKVAPIDDRRLGMAGGSYGGFMGMWTNTQTARFKAIVVGAGVSNWISYYGTNGIDEWLIPFYGMSAYADPDPYVKTSPITFISKAKTPTFIYVGERDIEVPPTQSVEYWHALKELGVPVSLVIYPDEGHGIRKPEHVMDVKARTMAWFKTYLGE
ncbi:hypothetical protein BH11PSE2_BH11PSE2_20000 [soil metagenome]